MSFSVPKPVELRLTDRSRLVARHFGDFVLLRRPDGSKNDMAQVGQRLFDAQFDFVEEVIATQVEACLALHQRFEVKNLSQIEALDFDDISDTRSQHHRWPILIDEQHADWSAIEDHTKLTQAEYLSRLFDCQLSVAMTGFLPGFVYLDGLPQSLRVPRKAKPATRTEAGTFALGGSYAGVYSLPSAAGWNCIGTIATQLFCEQRLPPVSVAIGDTVSLRRIDATEFTSLREGSGPSSDIEQSTTRNSDHGRLRVEHPGLLSLIQDRGRRGYAWYAIPRGGCMDATSAELANVILGQDAAHPVLEFHFLAPKIRFLSEAHICLTGADMGWQVNGEPVKRGQTLTVASGDLLSGNSASDGCRSYLAIRGEIATQKSFASASTYTPAKFGGNCGNAFTVGDELYWRKPSQPPFLLVTKIETGASEELLWGPGPEFSMLDARAQEAISKESFRIAPQSDRMGARLDGPRLLTQGSGQMTDSVPLLPGMVQLTPNGQLIVILQDGQTTGGYPRVGYLDRRAIEQLNQTKIGDPFRFKIQSL